MTRKKAAGFTFIELSISIVIIGIITGGILVAREMNRQAKLRAVMADLTRYEAAVGGFRDKYGYLPGDFPGATAIWDFAAGSTGTDATCQNAASTTKTCNGNGNGIIGDPSSTEANEGARAWQHLQNAELLDSGVFTGTFNGVAAGALTTRVLPPAKMDGVGYQFVYETKASELWTNLPTAEIGVPVQAIRAALPYTGADAPVRLGNLTFTPFEMYSIDEKIDDKKPGLGKVFIHYANSVNGGASSLCVSSSDAQASTYLTNTAQKDKPGCILHYSLQK